jgi:hypothetical protein
MEEMPTEFTEVILLSDFSYKFASLSMLCLVLKVLPRLEDIILKGIW